MTRRAFLTTLTSADRTLALAACRNAAPAPTSSPPTATTIAMAEHPAAVSRPNNQPILLLWASATPASTIISSNRNPPATRHSRRPADDDRCPNPTPRHAHSRRIAAVRYPRSLQPGWPAGRSLSRKHWHSWTSPHTQVAMVSTRPTRAPSNSTRPRPTGSSRFSAPDRTRDDMSTWFDAKFFIPYLGERLKLGVHRGIGEFHLYGEGASTAVIGQVLDLARRDKLLLHAHSDVRAIQILCERAPDLRILWAHAGFADPATPRQMVERFPQLLVETAIPGEIRVGRSAWCGLARPLPGSSLLLHDSERIARSSPVGSRRPPSSATRRRGWRASRPNGRRCSYPCRS